jgi:hypothetical protein
VGAIKLRQGSAVWREVDGETVVLDVASASYLGVNAAGSLLWPALERGTDQDELVDLLVSTFGQTRERAVDEVTAFLDVCRQRGLLEQ